MKNTALLSAALALMFFAFDAVAQDTYFVQSIKAKILAGPSFRAKPVGEALKGDKLVSIGRQGSWIKVLFEKKEGYISKLLVTQNPPLDRVSVIRGDEADIKKSVRRRASTYTSAAAARGLAQDDRRRLSRDEKTDYEGLEKMEAFSVTAQEVSRFMEGSTL